MNHPIVTALDRIDKTLLELYAWVVTEQARQMREANEKRNRLKRPINKFTQ